MKSFKIVLVGALLAMVSGYEPFKLFAEEAVADVTPNAGTPIDKIEPSTRPLNLTVELVTGTAIAGTLVDADVVNIKTAFGEAAIPLSEIAGIRFASREDVTTTVVMINGDSITGATDVKQVTVETDWGTAKVNGSAIQSLLLIPNLKWLSNTGVSGKRWSLVDAKANEPSSQPGALPTPSSTASRTLNNPGSMQPLPTQSVPQSLPAGTYYQNGILYRSGSVNQE